jgi:hypothetical protein
MLGLIKSFFSGKEADEIEAMVPANLPEEIAGLNFRAAIEAHMKWKSRLNEQIAGHGSEQIDVAMLSSDDKCILGQWIYNVGMKKYIAEPVFVLLHTSHASFHLSAGEVMTLVEQGQREQALLRISTGDYAKTSLQVVRQLALLWRKLG